MSNNIQPNLQLPTPCDFGPFAGGYCGKVVTIDFNQAQSKIDIADITIELLETATMSLQLSTLVQSIMPIDWTKTVFGDVATGVRNFDPTTTTLTYKPDETPSVDRVISFGYTVYDSLGATATALITINVVDKTPVLTAQSFSLSGTEAQIYTIDITQKVTATNTTVNYLDNTKAYISLAPTEGTATMANGIITFTPSLSPATTRTIPIKYTVKDLTGLTSEGTISITLTDVTPALSTTNISKSMMDNVNLTGSILSAITIKNDTFKTLTFGAVSNSMGTIVATGSNYTYTPNPTNSSDIVAPYTVTIPYTVTTTSGLSSTSNLVINITHYSLYANSIFYGNAPLDAISTPLGVINWLQTASNKTSYVGTYSLPARPSTYASSDPCYKWIVYPKAWGITPVILDASTLMEIAVDTFQYGTIGSTELVFIRTYYQINGAISIKLS